MKKLYAACVITCLMTIGMLIPNQSNSQGEVTDTSVETFVVKRVYFFGREVGPPIIYCFGHPKDCWTGTIEDEELD